ncbi:MAG: molecular chaperone [Chloroflexi bacterium HGW-Chloroflexi-4]|jgi:HSP20 family protein|nr:MAG: molecular chaperone [Chloroflexi bacterium HGW-Chloroflexi-4]
MNSSILPLRRRGNTMPTRRENDSPVMAIQNEMNRMFDQFFNDPFTLLSVPTLRSVTDFMPRIDVSETESAMMVTAELPGMEEKDIQLTLENDSLIISGEKKNDVEEKGKNFHRVERSYGSFQRVIPLISEIQQEKVEAKFRNGVLNITLPKTPAAAKQTHKIEIKSS